MKKIAVITCLLLSACATTPTGLAPAPEMPDLPPSLAKPAKQLPPLIDPTMGGSQLDGARDDMTYNEVSWQLNTIIKAWACVKKALAERKDATGCFNTRN